MIVLLFLVLGTIGCLVEGWTLMLSAGVAHLHLLYAVQPISYGVAMSFVLITIPVQLMGVLAGLAGDS
jgi:hypothetical protein